MINECTLENTVTVATNKMKQIETTPSHRVTGVGTLIYLQWETFVPIQVCGDQFPAVQSNDRVY